MGKDILCSSCTSGIFCPTWTSYKCTKYEKRFSSYDHPYPANCSGYAKRPIDFKEPKCQCESCLDNELLMELEDEEKEKETEEKMKRD